MNKKVYQKPTMCVVELQENARLLAGSYPGGLNYIPGIDTEEYNSKA